MLFALDWIDEVRTGIASFLMKLLDALTFQNLSYLMTENWFWTAVSLALAFTLCYFGFRYHRAVHGILAAIILGSFGWYLGLAANSDAIAIAWVYAIMMVLIAFFGIYIGYFINVFTMGFLFSIAVFSPFKNAFLGTSVFFAVLLSFVCCIIYAKFKPVMSAVYGGFMMGVIFYRVSPYVALGAAAFCILTGILAQQKLIKIYRIRAQKEMEDQIKKYPYGPGIAYGWEDPTLKNYGKNL